MILYILEGCHATGKTTILSKLKEENFDIFIKDEGYLNLNRFECNSTFHQCDWLLNWLHIIIKLKEEGKTKVISDRGPITSVIYGGEKFKFLADEIYNTLEKRGIKVINLVIKNPSKEILTQRIISRSGPLVNVELKNLENVIEKYEYYCNNYENVENINELKKLLNINVCFSF